MNSVNSLGGLNSLKSAFLGSYITNAYLRYPVSPSQISDLLIVNRVSLPITKSFYKCTLEATEKTVCTSDPKDPTFHPWFTCSIFYQNSDISISILGFINTFHQLILQRNCLFHFTELLLRKQFIFNVIITQISNSSPFFLSICRT